MQAKFYALHLRTRHRPSLFRFFAGHLKAEKIEESEGLLRVQVNQDFPLIHIEEILTDEEAENQHFEMQVQLDSAQMVDEWHQMSELFIYKEACINEDHGLLLTPVTHEVGGDSFRLRDPDGRWWTFFEQSCLTGAMKESLVVEKNHRQLL